MLCRSREVFFGCHETLLPYKDKWRLLVLLWKYKKDPYLLEYFSRRISKKIMDLALTSGTILVPVPGNPKNNRIRGYDPVFLLTKKISHQTGIPCKRLLTRIPGSSQKACGSNGRMSNLKGMIHLRKKRYSVQLAGIKIILLDDIYTTGATINECSKVLNGCQPETILCYTLAQD
jgi:ComF family protein